MWLDPLVKSEGVSRRVKTMGTAVDVRQGLLGKGFAENNPEVSSHGIVLVKPEYMFVFFFSKFLNFPSFHSVLRHFCLIADVANSKRHQ